MDSSIHINQRGESTLITLKGMLDSKLAESLTASVEKATPPVTLDLNQVSFISALGSLAIFNFYTDQQEKPKIQGANAHALSMLKLSGVIRYVEIIDSSDHSTPSVQE